MNAIDRLSLRWQFESFTPEAQESSYRQMLREFATAWHYKRNRYWIKRTLDRFIKHCRADVPIERVAKAWIPDFDLPADTWRKYAPPAKPEVYIGPDAYRQM